MIKIGLRQELPQLSARAAPFLKKVALFVRVAIAQATLSVDLELGLNSLGNRSVATGRLSLLSMIARLFFTTRFTLSRPFASSELALTAAI